MHDLVVVGAGPYGLSIAAHAAAAGLDLRVFGRPMASWREHMPPGMFLKSEPWASNLSDPDGAFGLAAYAATRGTEARHGVPLPVGLFASYGLWFAERAVPPVDERTITSVQACPGGFRLTAEDGERLLARTVALAVGVMPFIDIPAPLLGLDRAQVTHSSHHADLTRFAGGDVTVIGAGQAALETAALLAEQGTSVRLVARSQRLNWNTLPPPLERPAATAARAPHTGLGCGWKNWLYAETPGVFRRFPEATRARIFTSALGPAGAWWLRERFETAARVEVRLGESVVTAVPAGGRVRLELFATTGRTETVETDHVIAATGFTPGLDRLGLLEGPLAAGLRTVGPSRAPEASAAFESSYPGLFLAGLLSAPSFGPSMRFVYGASYTAERLVAGVRRRVGARGGPLAKVRQRQVLRQVRQDRDQGRIPVK
ncbi:NAD(P)-binding domain-containing protein [Streptomyces sp. JV176]|uniref:FAD-dependent oxidoreductase n=1 Tax=Streptomyces sp. JV176 TaxID=858630 RepID=UPI002E77E14D|nr:FAD-dependent oxidoreductase [Streptomyces sp. JV176]MEE1797154.1 NAD(P)-binding domain-containing protein [Streptomyces sp. JV176]